MKMKQYAQCQQQMVEWDRRAALRPRPILLSVKPVKNALLTYPTLPRVSKCDQMRVNATSFFSIPTFREPATKILNLANRTRCWPWNSSLIKPSPTQSNLVKPKRKGGWSCLLEIFQALGRSLRIHYGNRPGVQNPQLSEAKSSNRHPFSSIDDPPSATL